MPVYVFKTTDDEHREIVMSSEELQERQFDGDGGQFMIDDDGALLKRVYTPIGGQQPGTWPRESAACGVAINQVAEAEKHDREHGVPTKYNPKTGDAIFTSVGHQREHMKLHRMRDHDSFI
jgi:hypothetical protein